MNRCFVSPLSFCRRLNVATDKVLSYHQLKTSYKATKYPIVLCHGLSGFDSLVLLPKPQFFPRPSVNKYIKEGLIKVDYWMGIREVLEDIGCKVYIGKVPPFGSIEERATMLHEFLDQQFRQKNGSSSAMHVNLVSHSMGGLDSRYLISNFTSDYYKVRSLTTISTPHHGSEVADFVVNLLGRAQLLPKAVTELTIDNMKQFNKNVPNRDDVEYFSYGAKFVPKWYNVFKYPWQIIRDHIQLENATKSGHRTYDNDGLVSVESSKWGTYVGTIDSVDHLDLINWTNRTRAFFDKVLFNHTPKFNALALYLEIADNLQKRGY